MTSPDDELRESMVAHKAGRYAEAEAGYRRVLETRPADPKAMYYLGLLHHHRGDTAGAIELLRRCLSLAPSNASAWNTLGGLYIAADRRDEAREAYRRMTVAAPKLGEGWYNLGICLRDEGNIEAALDSLRTSVARQPDYFRSYEALATLLYRLDRVREASEVYSEWATRDPANATARHMAAATSQRDVPARAAEEYVRSLFDDSAKSFDADLERLGYRAPALVVEGLERAMELRGSGVRGFGVVLDGGCGTGLCGPLLLPRSTTLVGVDLSQQMIERATERACYDELVVAELSAFMRSRPATFDTIVSADTLVYFGALEEPLAAARVALKQGGSGWLVFTVEMNSREGEGDYRLGAHGRYVHSESYVRQALALSGLRLETLTYEMLRDERGEPVKGMLVVARA
jgi:predicted TPR repeat methyltransferase